MHAWSDLSSLPAHGSRLSSSLPPQSRINRHPSSSSHARTRYFDFSTDETPVVRRTHAFRQLNKAQPPLQLNHKLATSAGIRQMPVSQPVVVRTYSPRTDEAPPRGFTMSRRSNFVTNTHIPLPPVEDFGIEGILRALEPDIRSTIDAIAEICGRSKLSLANEYGSHRPPLGEIRAPSRSVEHGLLTVEEASSSVERLVDENVLVVRDDTSTLDWRDHYSSTSGPLETIQSNVCALAHRMGATSSLECNTSSQRRRDPQLMIPAKSSPSTSSTKTSGGREDQRKRIRASSNPHVWALLGREPEVNTKQHRQSIQVQPVISEVRLDVELGHRRAVSDAQVVSSRPIDIDERVPDKSVLQAITQRFYLLSDLRSWIEWWNRLGHSVPAACGGEQSPSAAMRLRAVLEQHEMQLGISSPTVHAS